MTNFVTFPSPSVVLFKTAGLNFNSVADQAIPIRLANVSSYYIRGIRIVGTNGALATASGGIYNGTGKPAGGIIVAPTAFASVTASGQGVTLSPTPLGLGIRTSQTLYLSLDVAEGVARTGGIIIWASVES